MAAILTIIFSVILLASIAVFIRYYTAVDNDTEPIEDDTFIQAGWHGYYDIHEHANLQMLERLKVPSELFGHNNRFSGALRSEARDYQDWHDYVFKGTKHWHYPPLRFKIELSNLVDDLMIDYHTNIMYIPVSKAWHIIGTHSVFEKVDRLDLLCSLYLGHINSVTASRCKAAIAMLKPYSV